MVLSLAQAKLIALLCESIIFGIFLATFLESVKALVWTGSIRKPVSQIRWGLLMVTIYMFIVSCLEAAFVFIEVYTAFTLFPREKMALAFQVAGSWTPVARGILLPLQTIMGDLVLIYRCWVIYNNNWRVIALPLVLEVATGFSACVVPYLELHSPSNSVVTAHHLNIWTTTAISLLLATNTVTTGLIIYRVMATSSQTRSYMGSMSMSSHGRTPLQFALRVFIDSGLLFAISSLILLALALAKTPAVYVLSDSTIPIVGICFNLIIIRVNRHNMNPPSASKPSVSHPLRFLSTTNQPTASQATENVHVDVTRETDFDIESGTKAAEGPWAR